MKGYDCFLENLMHLIKRGRQAEFAHRLRPEIALMTDTVELFGREAAARWLWTQPLIIATEKPKIQMLSAQLMLQQGWAFHGKVKLKYVLVVDVLLDQLVHLTLLKESDQATDKNEESLRLEHLLKQTQKFWLEWDIQQDTLHISENWLDYLHSSSQETHSWHRLSPSAAQIAKIRTQLQQGKSVPEMEIRLNCGEKGMRWYRLELVLEKDDQGQPSKVLGLLSDNDQQQREIQWLRRLAHQDCLTGLYNRFMIQQLIEEALRSAVPEQHMTLAVMDIDNFKQINDAYGHDCGDEMLRQTALQIRKLFAPEDLVGRIGGDEFVILMQTTGTCDQVSARLDRIREQLQCLRQPSASSQGVSCNIGCAFFPTQGTTYKQLFLKADAAMYQAKRQGKNSCVFY